MAGLDSDTRQTRFHRRPNGIDSDGRQIGAAFLARFADLYQHAGIALASQGSATFQQTVRALGGLDT